MIKVEKRIVIYKNTLEVKKGVKPEYNPDLRGSVTINNITYYLSLWNHVKDGKKTSGGKVQTYDKESNTSNEVGDIIIFLDANNQLKGVLTINGVQFEFNLYTRKSEKIKAFWEGQCKLVEMKQENDSDELPF